MCNDLVKKNSRLTSLRDGDLLVVADSFIALRVVLGKREDARKQRVDKGGLAQSGLACVFR